MCFLSLEQGIGVGGVAKLGVCKNKYTHTVGKTAAK